MRRVHLALAVSILLHGCSSKDNLYCDRQTPCADSALVCDLATNTCTAPSTDRGLIDGVVADAGGSHENSPKLDLGRDVSRLDVPKADLSRADLSRADLSKADLSKADLSKADLSKLGPGKLCSTGTQCISGNCVEGVCCDKACAGTCTSCKVTGKVGTCSPVPKGSPDPRGGCTGDPGCVSGCNGAGACDFAKVDTACGTPTCTGAQQTEYSCNGTGQCTNKTITSCGLYQCGGNKCLTSCTAHSHCVSGFCDLFDFPFNNKNKCAAAADVCIGNPSLGTSLVNCLTKKYIAVPAGTYTDVLKIKTPVQIVATTQVSASGPFVVTPTNITNPTVPTAKLRPPADYAAIHTTAPTLLYGLEIFHDKPTSASSYLVMADDTTDIRSCYVHSAGPMSPNIVNNSTLLLSDVQVAGDVLVGDSETGIVANSPLYLSRVVVGGAASGIIHRDMLKAREVWVSLNNGPGITSDGASAYVDIDRAFIEANTGAGLVLSPSVTGQVWNTLVHGNWKQGVSAPAGTTNLRFYNVTIADNGGVEIEGRFCSNPPCGCVIGGPCTPLFHNSIISDSKTSGDFSGQVEFRYSDIVGLPSPGATNVNSSPSFVTGGYDLLPSSPCKDLGSTALSVTYPATDIIGRPRIVGGKISQGAYQVQ